MEELFYFLSILLLLFLWYIAYQDYKTKLIHLWSFYLLNIIWLTWFFLVDGYGKYIMLWYFIIIFFLDILEYFRKLPSFISEDWMIGGTWVYDYWIYLFIISVFVDFLPSNFILYYIIFTISIIVWLLLAYFLTKKRYDKHIPLFVYWFFIIFFIIFFIFIFR